MSPKRSEVSRDPTFKRMVRVVCGGATACRNRATRILLGESMNSCCKPRGMGVIALAAALLAMAGPGGRAAFGQPAETKLRVEVGYGDQAPVTAGRQQITLRPNPAPQPITLQLFNGGEEARTNLKIRIVDEKTGITLAAKTIAKLAAKQRERIQFVSVAAPTPAKDAKDGKDGKKE